MIASLIVSMALSAGTMAAQEAPAFAPTASIFHPFRHFHHGHRHGGKHEKGKRGQHRQNKKGGTDHHGGKHGGKFRHSR